MKVTKQDVEKIAHLARLELDPNKTDEIQTSINKVLDWMEALNQVDTTGVEPLVHITPAINQFREDVAIQKLDRQTALDLAPDANDQYFKVPQVIE
ncbi:Asp-tRNA(Asn)/Glu-tRNA(Gln) amidotransferase subunit GatC [Aquirufa sp. ROCK2-A2]